MSFESLGIITKSGKKRYSTTCPQCSPTRKKKNDPCLTVNDEVNNQWYNCNHCGWSGNLGAIEYEKKIKEKAFIPKTKAKVYSTVVRNYLSKRKISQSTALDFEMYEPEGKAGVVAFPFKHNNTLVNVKFIGISNKKFWQISKDDGAKKVLLGIDAVKIDDKEDYIIIVEGQWDLLSWKEAGYRNVVSVPDGAPAIEAKNYELEFKYLEDPIWNMLLERVNTVYLAVDNDAAGEKLKEELSQRIGKSKCSIVRYSKDHKDTNDELVDGGVAAVHKIFKSASPYPIKGIINIDDVDNELAHIREFGFERGMTIGDKELDKIITVKAPYLYFYIGVMGMGKSTFLRWFLMQLTKKNTSERIGLYSPEMRPAAREYSKLIECYCEKNLRSKSDNIINDSEYIRAKQFIRNHFYIIAPDRNNFDKLNKRMTRGNLNTLHGIFDYVIYLKRRYGITGYVIDPWNKIESAKPSGMSDTEYIGQQLDNILEFNEEHNLHAHVLLHPSKDRVQKLPSGNFTMPSIYAASGSAHFANRADVGVVIHRKPFKQLSGLTDVGETQYSYDPNAPTMIYVEKGKFEEIATSGGQVHKFMNKKKGDIFVDEVNINDAPLPSESDMPPQYRADAFIEPSGEYGGDFKIDGGDDDTPF